MTGLARKSSHSNSSGTRPRSRRTHSLNQLFAETFIFVDIDGSLQNKAQFLASVSDRSEHIDSIRSESMLRHVHGDTVIVTGVYHEKGTLKGEAYYHHGRFTDTRIKDGSAWLCAASQSTLIQKERSTKLLVQSHIP